MLKFPFWDLKPSQCDIIHSIIGTVLFWDKKILKNKITSYNVLSGHRAIELQIANHNETIEKFNNKWLGL